MAYPQTGSKLYDVNGKNRTGTSLSTNIVIKVGTETVGAIQSISYTESRSIYMLNEVGTDGHVDSSPQSSTKHSGNCTRVRFDRLRITEAFSRGFVHVHSQRYPFDIEIIDVQNAASDAADAANDPNTIVTVLKNCWINNLQTTYSSSDFIISEQMGFDFETIESYLAGGGLNVSTGGERNLNLFRDELERQADRGGRRGALDAPGLIRAFTNPF